jgi:putative mRNA 3-end processing factor
VALVEVRAEGLYCPPGNFYIDPWAHVPRAVVTHAHAVAANALAGAYLTAEPGKELLRPQVRPRASLEYLEYGESHSVGDVRISFHPAGHILGSAQVRIEHGGAVWVVSGHYKLAPDPTCAPFEPVRCHTFVTEATFALPIFRWPDTSEIRDAIHAWWRANQEAARSTLLFTHPVGQAQRLLAMLDPSIGPIFTHESVESASAIYREQGIRLPPSTLAANDGDWRRALVLAPPAAHGSAWEHRFGPASTALASGWMRIRGTRRRRSLDRGFVLSDHADWPGLLRAIAETRAERIWVTGGFRGPLTRWLQEHGREALALETPSEEAEP